MLKDQWLVTEKGLKIVTLNEWNMSTHLTYQYRWTWIWRTTVRQIFAYDGQYAWSQSDAYQVFVICIRQILHMTDQFSWSHWVHHFQVHLYSIKDKLEIWTLFCWNYKFWKKQKQKESISHFLWYRVLYKTLQKLCCILRMI